MTTISARSAPRTMLEIIFGERRLLAAITFAFGSVFFERFKGVLTDYE
jgi:hypothetical protein